MLSQHWGIVTLRPHAVNMGPYANWLKQGDCKSLTEKDTLGVRIPPGPQFNKFFSHRMWYNYFMNTRDNSNIINWNKRGYTKEEFIKAWEQSVTRAEVLVTLKIWGYGGNYETLNRTARILNLSDEHFQLKSVQTENARKTMVKRTIPLGKILVENSFYNNTSALRKRLIAEGLKEEKCEICSLSEWMGGKIPLDLDHVNGIKHDNRIENLRVICKNCHGQTPTYGSKNKKSAKINYELKLAKKKQVEEWKANRLKKREEIASLTCSNCPNKISRSSGGRCTQCAKAASSKASYPEIDVIIENIEAMGYEAYGRILGVSGNAIKKHLRNRGVINLPSRQKAKVICFKCSDEALPGKKSCEAHKPRKETYPPIEDIIAGVTKLGWKKYAAMNGINDYRNIIHHLKQRNIPLPSKDKI